MAHDLATFRVRFPEFVLQQDPYVQAYLDAAVANLSASMAAKPAFDELVMYRAAHMLALTPAGFTAGLSTVRYESHYQLLYKRLVREACGGFYVV